MRRFIGLSEEQENAPQRDTKESRGESGLPKVSVFYAVKSVDGKLTEYAEDVPAERLAFRRDTCQVRQVGFFIINRTME